MTATAADIAQARALVAVGFTGEALVRWVAYGIAESQSDPNALADRPSTGDYSVGVWQINYYTTLRADRTARYGPPDQLLGNLPKQAAAVWDLSSHGTNPAPWSADDRNGKLALYTPRAREAVAALGAPQGDAPMALVYPGARWRPCTNQSHTMSAHLGLILHVQVGYNDLYAQFNNPSSQSSYTWDAYPDGTGDQFCDALLHAWAQGAGNDTYNSCGTKGFPNERLTEACCVWIAGLYRWGHGTLGWPYRLAEVPDEPGFGWHGMGDSNGHTGWGGHPNCPGDIRKGQRQHILDLAQGSIPAPPPTAPPTPPRKRFHDMLVQTPNGGVYFVSGNDATHIVHPEEVPGLLAACGQPNIEAMSDDTLANFTVHAAK